MRLILIGALLSLLALPLLPDAIPSYQIPFTSIKKLINSEKTYGTAFVVRHTWNGFLVLTCEHVARDAVTLRWGELSGGTVVWSDKVSDTSLVLFKTDERPAVVRLTQAAPRALSHGLTAGYPLPGDRLHISPVLFQGDAHIHVLAGPGSSGSPVFDEHGLVVGMIANGSLMRIRGGGRVDAGWMVNMSRIGTVISRLW